LGGLDRDAVDRAGGAAQIAGDAALLAARIAGEDDAGAVAVRNVRLLLRVLDRDRAREQHLPERDAHAGDDFPDHAVTASRAAAEMRIAVPCGTGAGQAASRATSTTPRGT